MTPTSRRSFLLVLLSGALALAAVLGGGGLAGESTQTAAAAPAPAPASAPALAPAAAPDNSIALQPFLPGLSSPVLLTHAGDGSGRLFVVEQGGLIKVVVNGAVRPTPFLDLRSKVVAGGEQGLLGLAFHPNYESNNRFFVFYTAKPPGGQTANVGSDTLEEYQVSSNPEVANPTAIRTLFALPDRATNHNAGMLGFSPKDSAGYLYVSTGDEGGGGDTFGNSQNLDTLYAKILRLDVDNIPSGKGYGIPATNPFAGQGDIRGAIWAYGFRNPWRWSFDRQTGDMMIGDVGQGTYEEIDVIPSLLTGQNGRNYGWNVREGLHCFNASTCANTGFVDPILEYPHTDPTGNNCSVTGGYRYRGSVNPALQGSYFYADYCSGRIWRANGSGSSWSTVEALDTSHNISAFGEDEAGEVYVVTLSGSIFKLAQTAVNCSARPRVTLQSARTGPGMYDVILTASDSATVSGNVLQSVAFNRIVNGSVTIGAQTNQRDPFTATLQGTGTTARFSVQRLQAGATMQIDFKVTDRCGEWSTFFGTGPGVQ